MATIRIDTGLKIRCPKGRSTPALGTLPFLRFLRLQSAWPANDLSPDEDGTKLVTLFLTGLPLELDHVPRGSVSLFTASSSASGLLRAMYPGLFGSCGRVDQQRRPNALVPLATPLQRSVANRARSLRLRPSDQVTTAQDAHVM
jgi:hypothetical protein